MEPNERFRQSLDKLQEILSSAPHQRTEETIDLLYGCIIELKSLATVARNFEQQVKYLRKSDWLKEL